MFKNNTEMQTNEEMGIAYIPEVVERLRAQKYADLMMDWTFKYVFGPSGKYQEGLVSLLNAIIPEKRIKSIEYLPTEILGEVSEQRTVLSSSLRFRTIVRMVFSRGASHTHASCFWSRTVAESTIRT